MKTIALTTRVPGQVGLGPTSTITTLTRVFEVSYMTTPNGEGNCHYEFYAEGSLVLAVHQDLVLELRDGGVPHVQPGTVSSVNEQERREPETVVNFVFEGPPDHESPRFVETELITGTSVGVGRWLELPNGYWALQVMVPSRYVRQHEVTVEPRQPQQPPAEVPE